jgi:hypothetical protein
MSCVKLFVCQVQNATQEPDGFVLRGVRFTRVWLQGVVVAASADSSELLLDDGSGALKLRLKGRGTALASSREGGSAVGAEVLVLGKLLPASGGEGRSVRASSLLDLSQQPDRQTLWPLEVVELWRDVLPLVHARQ